MKGPKAVAIQPDYGKWLAVKVGMEYKQVLSLLGEPEPMHGMRRTPGESYYLSYGHIAPPAVPVPSPYRFTVGFDSNDLVSIKLDPFNGVFSTDGLPAKPQILIPLEGNTFGHYPRVLDVRWGPVSGVYPIDYELEIAADALNRETTYHVVQSARDIREPYFLTSYVGAGNARLRVRGSNARGLGEWSDYRHFGFAQ